MCLYIFGLFFLKTYAEHQFLVQAFKKLYLARTKNPNFFIDGKHNKVENDNLPESRKSAKAKMDLEIRLTGS